MPLRVRTGQELELMRHAGRVLALLNEELGRNVRPGISTAELDRIAREFIAGSEDCTPAFLDYDGFPAAICTSVNDEVVHGIPDVNRILKEGDIVKLDAGVLYRGWYSDAARTWAVGEISSEKRKLMEVTEQAFFEAMKAARDGAYLYDIGRAVEDYVKSFGYAPAREYTGHAIGPDLHEDPMVPNYKPIGRGMRLKAGMTLAIEPIINMGSPRVICEGDWITRTADGKASAHYENTILITEGAPEILTLAPGEVEHELH